MSWKDNDIIELKNFRSYVDWNFDPILGPDGVSLFEKTLDDPELDLSDNAKAVAKKIFELTIKLSKETNGLP